MKYGRWRTPYKAPYRQQGYLEVSYSAGTSLDSRKNRNAVRERNKHEILLGFKDFVRYGRCFRHTPEGSTYPIKRPATD